MVPIGAIERDRGAARPAERALRLRRDRRRRQHHHQEGRRTGAVQRCAPKAGSYGTLSSIGSLTGSQRPVVLRVHRRRPAAADGFSRYGYRIPSIEARFPISSRTASIAGPARRASATTPGKACGSSSACVSTRTRARLRPGDRRVPRYALARRAPASSKSGRAPPSTPGGALTHNLHVFANRTDRTFNDVTYRINTLPQNTTSIITDFIGDRVGARVPGQSAHRRVRLAHLRRQDPSARPRNTFTEQRPADAAAARCRCSPASRRRAAVLRPVAVAGRRAADPVARRPRRRRASMSTASRPGARPPPT